MRGTKPYAPRELPHQGRFAVWVSRDARRALQALARRSTAYYQHPEPNGRRAPLGAVASAVILDAWAAIGRGRRSPAPRATFHRPR